MRAVLLPLLLAALLAGCGCVPAGPPVVGNGGAAGSGQAGVAPEGSLDLADCRRIAGWAWARAQPDAPLQVDILDGETRLGTVTADLHRDDLAKNGKGNGNHGFSLVVPPSLKDSQPHAISARVADGGITLHGSPKTLNCGRE